MNQVVHSAPAVAAANGIELTYDTFGERRDPPLLLIMGLGAQMVAWDEEFCGQLAARGYWVIRFDNRDVGRSTRLDAAGVPNVGQLFQDALQGKPVTAPYTLRDMARDAIGLLDALTIETAHVVGASMGGMIGQEMAIHHPGRMRSFTSIMSSSGAPGLPQARPEALAILFTPTPTEREAYTARFLQMWKVLRGPGFPLDEARDPARAAETFERGVYPAGIARQLAATLASGDRSAALAGVRVPTLVIHGDADPLVPLEHGIDTAKRIAGARLLTIPGMGHALPITMWGQIVEAIAGHAR